MASSTTPGTAPACAGYLLVLQDDVAPCLHDDELAALGQGGTRNVGDLRILDAERRGLPHLELDDLFQVRGFGRHFLKPHEGHFADAVRDDEGDPAGPMPDLLPDLVNRPRHVGRPDNVRGVQRRDHGAVGQRLHSPGRHLQRGTASRHRHCGDAALADLEHHARRRRAEQGGRLHSTNVTLLISRSVVTPCITRSTAHSRRNRSLVARGLLDTLMSASARG